MAERVLVISVDGLAPRVITRATMPNLTRLALRGAACYEATTVVPPITVPAHASMIRGVDPSVHQLVDNTPMVPRTAAPSFVAHARQHARSTASVICWPPLDLLLEPDASTHRVSLDAGYSFADDRRVVAHARALLDGRPDLTFVYLVATDLAGHATGWDSDQYRHSASVVDRRLGELFEAAGPDTAIVVTTDHGGSGCDHHEPVDDTLATFVVVRSARVGAGSTWAAASILDIAPTVTDLLGIPPHPAWARRSLLGSERPILHVIHELPASMADVSYGERVDMLSHSLQAAALAAADQSGEALVLAALLHDIGHRLADADAWGRPDHAELGARYLQAWFDPTIVEPIRLHVAAKRALVASDPSYLTELSEASRVTLEQQGGALDREGLSAFRLQPFCDDAIAVRRWDDAGKRHLDVPPLDEYLPMLAAALRP